MNKCQNCQKEIEERYKLCAKCFEKTKQKKKKEEGMIDLTMAVKVPLIVLIALFVLGMMIGAILW